MSSNVGSGFRAVILFFKNFKNGLPLYKNMQQSVPELFCLQKVFLKNTRYPKNTNTRSGSGSQIPAGSGSGPGRYGVLIPGPS